jgi:hypothetical protein
MASSGKLGLGRRQDMEQLTIGGIFSNALTIGLKNAVSLLGAVVLWALTVWIPYLNVGTTIGLVGIIAKMGRGEVVSPTEIFDSANRRRMGEFFLVVAFISMGASIGTMFMIVPGIVIGIAWGLAPLLVLDKGMNPIAAIEQSNNLTYGKKATIFWGGFLLTLALYVATIILAFIFTKVHPMLGALVTVACLIVIVAVSMGVQAYVYRVLVDSEEENPL